MNYSIAAQSTQPDLRQTPNYYSEVATGTTLVAVQYDGGIIMAADRRTSMGSMVANRFARKAYYIADQICVLGAGSAADNQILSNIVKNYMRMYQVELDDQPRVKVSAHVLSSLSYNNKNNLSSSMIVGGYDPIDGFQIYAIPSGGSLIARNDFYAAGSGQVFLSGFMDANYRPGMTFEEARQLVIESVSQAIKRDAASGGGIKLTHINKEELVEEYIGFDKIRHYSSQGVGMVASNQEIR